MNAKQSVTLVSTSALAAGMAQGSVIYSGPLNLQQTYSAANYRQGVDLTGDSLNDFAFGYEAAGLKPYIDARTYVGTDVPPQSGILSELSKANRGLPVTPAGTLINASYAAIYPPTPGGRAYLYEDDTASVAGDWSNTATTDAYVGIELNLPGGSSYGWLHFIDDPVAQSLTLRDWAYESTPGVGILTVVPEPSSLALTGLGLAAVWLSRKRQ